MLQGTSSFLCIESDDPQFDRHATAGFSGEFGAGRDSGSGAMRKFLRPTSPGVSPARSPRADRGTAGQFWRWAMGCSRLDMQDQPKYRPQRPRRIFRGWAQRASARRRHHRARHSRRGHGASMRAERRGGQGDVEAFPIARRQNGDPARASGDTTSIARHCHGRIGERAPAWLCGAGSNSRLTISHRSAANRAGAGHFYDDVIANGYGAMLNYTASAKFSRRTEWAIVAYIRALQYSENANINDPAAGARESTRLAGAVSAFQSAAQAK